MIKEQELSPYLPIIIKDIQLVIYKNKVSMDTVKQFLADFVLYYYFSSLRKKVNDPDNIYYTVFTKLYEHTNQNIYKYICDQINKNKKNYIENNIKVIFTSFLERIEEIIKKAKQFNYNEYVSEYNQIILYFSKLLDKMKSNLIKVEINTNHDDILIFLHYNNYIGIYKLINNPITYTNFIEHLEITKTHITKSKIK